MDSIMEKDLYELIGVVQTASTQEIKKAYRKKALSCHPDKNPDKPEAAELFQELSRALEILTDISARAAYDKVVNAKLQAKLRAKEFDSKRRKLKEDLEARENAYKNATENYNVKREKDKLKVEIEKLQKEGSKQLEEEITLMKKHFENLSRTRCTKNETDQGSYKIKVKWVVNKHQSNNGGYDYDTLYRILSKYGDINILVVSTTKGGRALVEYKRKSDAELAANTEHGLAHNPLKLQKLWDELKETSCTKRSTSNITNFTKPPVTENISDSEFELSVLRNLRKAEERKRSFARSME